MKRLIIILLVCFATQTIFSQDPYFFNSYNSLVYLNPSFAGSNGNIRDQAVYRNQWPNLSGTYVTISNSFDAFIKPIKAGVSLSYLHDDQGRGILKTDVVTLGYAQYFSLAEGKLKIIPSLQAAYFVKQLDVNRLSFGGPYYTTQFAPTQLPSNRKSNFDFNTGLLINYLDFYFGTTVFHFTQPDEGLFGLSKLPYRLSIHASYNKKISDQVLLNFFSQFNQQQQFNLMLFQANALFINHIIASIGYSTNDVINSALGYKSNFFTASIGYDQSVSKLSGNVAGSWQLHTSFNLRNKENRKTLTNFEAW